MYRRKMTQETGFQKQGSAASREQVVVILGNFPIKNFNYGKV